MPRAAKNYRYLKSQNQNTGKKKTAQQKIYPGKKKNTGRHPPIRVPSAEYIQKIGDPTSKWKSTNRSASRVTNATQRQKSEPECEKTSILRREKTGSVTRENQRGGYLNFKKRLFDKQIYKDERSFTERDVRPDPSFRGHSGILGTP